MAGSRLQVADEKAKEILLSMTELATASTVRFSEWLTLGIAGAFSLLVANLGSVAPFLDSSALKLALAFAGVALCIGLYGRWISSGVFSGILAVRSADEASSTIAPDFHIRALKVYVMRGFQWPYRKGMWRSFHKQQGSSAVAAAIARRSQTFGVLVIVQVVFASLAAAAIVLGAINGV